MGFLASLIGAFLDALFQAIVTAWKGERERADLGDAHERAGATAWVRDSCATGGPGCVSRRPRGNAAARPAHAARIAAVREV